MESLDIAYTRSLRGQEGDEDSWARFDEVFRTTFLRLQNAGAEFGFIASNTPHMRIHAITKKLDFPVISILDATASAVKDLEGERALILGTSVTMKSRVYADTLKKYDIEAVPQLPDDIIAEIARLIDVDLYQNKTEAARDRILELSRAYTNDSSGEVVCLACTELPLAFPEHQNVPGFSSEGISFVNSTVAHVDAVLKYALD